MSKLLIVIPAHNEEANIVRVVEELTTQYPQYDYVVVNDGSRDKTAAVCRAHGFHLIDLPINLGLAGAFQTGLRYAAFVADTDPATLAGALRALLADPEGARASADRAYARLCGRFTWQAVFATMMEVARNAKS